MTQVKEWSNAELNRRLALLMGYTEDKCYPGRVVRGNAVTTPNDYCTNPASSLEVQTKAIEVDHKNYILNLTEIIGAQHPTLDLYIAALLTATPRERAEAAYITLSQIEKQMQGEPCCLVGRCEECDPITDDENHL